MYMYVYVYIYIYNIYVCIYNIYTALCILKISSDSLLKNTAPLPPYIKKTRDLQLHVQVNVKRLKKAQEHSITLGP